MRRGKKVYLAQCVDCHGAMGDGAVPPEAMDVFRSHGSPWCRMRAVCGFILTQKPMRRTFIDLTATVLLENAVRSSTGGWKSDAVPDEI